MEQVEELQPLVLLLPAHEDGVVRGLQPLARLLPRDSPLHVEEEGWYRDAGRFRSDSPSLRHEGPGVGV